jgi:reverse gyrase
MFNEITKKSIEKAFEKPAQVNINLVDAQQARRVLDRLVGYKISPLLWDKVRRGLSAGPRPDRRRARDCGTRTRNPRVRQTGILDARRQSGREEEARTFDARLFRKGEDQPEIPDQAASDALVADLEGAKFIVKSVGTKEKRRNPVAPFITSTLQQESSRKLRFSVKRTMMLAQQLYEGVESGQRRLGRSDHLHAYRFDARLRRRRRRSARVHRRQVRPAISARRAQRLQIEERRAGRARSHSPHLRHAHARRRGAVPRRRPAQAVPADLDALHRLADESGGLRSDHDRRERQRQVGTITPSAPPAR